MRKMEKLTSFAIMFLSSLIFLIIYGFTFFVVGVAIRENGIGTYLLEFIFVSIPLLISSVLLAHVLLLISGKIKASKTAGFGYLALFITTLCLIFNLLATYSGNWLGYLLIAMFSATFLLLFYRNKTMHQ